MKFMNFHRRPVSMFVMVAFTIMLCFWANQTPAAPSAPPTEKSPAAVAAGTEEGTGYVEQEESAATVKQGKKFPWLIVGAVVVIGAAALYFLVLKKTKYTLTVAVGPGTTGTPTATAKYKKGEIVAYNYAAQTGYGELQVKLDGVAVAASGTVTMDKDHSITVSATQRATIQVNSSPAGAKIYLDKADTGQVTPYTFNYSAATTKAVLLRHQCGYQEWTQTVTANLGQDIVVAPVLAKGIFEEFDIPASPCWLPRTASAWSVSAGGLKVANPSDNGYEYNFYNSSFSPDFTITVKQKFEQGRLDDWFSVIFSTSKDMTNSKGYEFDFTAEQEYALYKNNSYNFIKDKGSWSWIKRWSRSIAFNKGLGVWNTIKIVKKGANYSFYANDTFLFSFVNEVWDVRYVALAAADEGMKVHIDSVLLTTGSSSQSVPGLHVHGVPSTTAKRNRDRR